MSDISIRQYIKSLKPVALNRYTSISRRIQVNQMKDAAEIVSFGLFSMNVIAQIVLEIATIVFPIALPIKKRTIQKASKLTIKPNSQLHFIQMIRIISLVGLRYLPLSKTVSDFKSSLRQRYDKYDIRTIYKKILPNVIFGVNYKIISGE
ncbi:MAG: hypothetical protein EXX96DRAFT_534097 [Benjaminiella poitrasii]|nr:MAG: hypothetical protein EXX96DRAFT_534097 [Benjaminiella poitrasii]